ncbi:MORN repeat-containing protein 5-like [Ceratina calcarata]|uniref:MORN repeat-containing protein 5 n=1 Tax=Ceratina calcarata TaxID=156304 RepID=A0AAJ7NAZ8_9HYME|nr:MORN repeat-containing protein 5-like [Ceratina calcarata]
MSVQFKNFPLINDETRFIDGSEYKGTWDTFGMDGIGKFTLPHNTIFEGEFRHGKFHGHGSMYWPRGQRVDGIWSRGKCEGKEYVFNDSLNFSQRDWKYCKFPDRRYFLCHKYGLRPAGATLRKNDPYELAVPPRCYDSGIGIFNPRTRCITSYQNPKKVLEIPSTEHARWIVKNCQKGTSPPTGHRRELYENWFSPDFDEKILSSRLPFTSNSFEPWWQRLTTFRRDNSWKEEKLEDPCLCLDDESPNADENIIEPKAPMDKTPRDEIVVSPTVSCRRHSN